jgi:hypothetical protein
MLSRRIYRLAGICVLLLVAALVAFALFLRARSGKDYRGDLAALLPARTAVYLSLEDLNGLWDRVAPLKIHDALGKKLRASWLIDDEDSDPGEDATLESQVKGGLLRRFIRRWFGRSVVAAMFSVEGRVEPAFVVLAKTDMGFEENLAQLVADCYPSLAFEEEVFNDVRLLRYRGEKPDESLTFCRFGRTVAIGLMSDSFEPLKAIARRRHGGEAVDSLDVDPGFAACWPERRDRSGAALYLNAARAFADVESYPKLRLEEKERRRGNFTFLRRILEPMDRVFGVLNLQDAPLGIHGEFRAAKSAPNPVEPDFGPSRVPPMLPRDALMCLAGRSERLGQVVRDLTFGFPEGSEMRGETEEWSEKIRGEFGLDLESELLPLLQGEMAMAWTGVEAGIAFPRPHWVALAQVRDSAEAQALLDRAYARYEKRRDEGKPSLFPGLKMKDEERSTKSEVRRAKYEEGRTYALPTLFLGAVEVGLVGDFLVVGGPAGALDRLAEAYARNDPARGMASSPVFALTGLRAEAAYPLLLYANFASAREAVRRAAAGSLLWPEKVREDVQDFQDSLEIPSLLRGARLIRDPSTSSPSVDLFIPLQ